MNEMADFNLAEIELMIQRIDEFSPEEQREIEQLADVLEQRKLAATCRDDLIEFCKHMDPNYKVGKHHRRLADLLMKMERGEEDRIGVSVPPRHGKSQMVSIYFPAWYLGRNPDKKVLMVSHTADLAVDFGRKVRNTVGSPAYRQIFPTVTLAADSKSAGRWNTNMGGEYFACLRRYALVHTTKGAIPAARVQVGDTLLNAGKPVRVLKIYNSQHDSTYQIHKLDCSAEHPIWTMQRGWVYASDVQPCDILCTESISDIMKALIRRAYGYLEYTYVPSLVQHKVSMHKPEQREVGRLWGAGNYFVRTVANIRSVFAGYGVSPVARTYSGADRQQRAIQSRELPLGNYIGAAKQQTYQRVYRGQDTSATRQTLGGLPGNYTLPNSEQYEPVEYGKKTQEELRAYGNPEGLGWMRSFGTRVLGLCSKNSEPNQSPSGIKKYLASVRGAAQNVFGLLLGVRHAGVIKKTVHTTPKHFVNFLTDGDHTFFAGKILTHNCGVGAALAGRGAHFLIVDDPFSEQDVLNGNYEVFERVYEWFTYGARTRLMPQGKVAIVHCMTGDTGVLTADGTEKPLRDVRPGDSVATYDNGRITSAKVLNWANQGRDCVYTIRMTSGTIVRANQRHPFLVSREGITQWIKVKNLTVNMTVVSIGQVNGMEPYVDTTDVTPQFTPIIYAKATTEKNGARLGKLHPPQKSIGVNGVGLLVQLMGVGRLCIQKVCAVLTTIKNDGTLGSSAKPQNNTATITLWNGMVSASRHTIKCWGNKVVNALFAITPPVLRTPLVHGATDLPSTTAITPIEYGRFSATTAILSLNTMSPKKSCAGPLSIYRPTLDTIAEIKFDGYEDVFDIQVEGTENFIANGIVSHNTRWHPNDLLGRLAKDMGRISNSDQYDMFEFPAIFNENTDHEKALWPEFYDLTALHRTKASMPLFQWNAQYQQNPTAEEGALIKREWWRKWEAQDPPQCEYIIMTLDAAAEKHNRADFTALLTWGVFADETHTENNNHIILLNAINVRLEFPELKEMAMREYKEWQPDSFIVEKKSSGTPLFQEMRRMGIPVQEFTPHRGTGDKIARVNAISDIFRSGLVWYPEGLKWAEAVVEQVAGFPASDNDDMVDCVAMALARFRNGGFIRLTSDAEEGEFQPRLAAYY